MSLEKILQYQKKDEEIIEIEKKLEHSPNKKAMINLQKVGRELSEISISCEKESSEIVKQYNELKAIYEKNIKPLQLIQEKNIDSMSEKEVGEFLKVSNALSKNLNLLDKKLEDQAKRIQNVLASYEEAKDKYKQTKESLIVYKANFEKESKEQEPRILALRKELSELGKFYLIFSLHISLKVRHQYFFLVR